VLHDPHQQPVHVELHPGEIIPQRIVLQFADGCDEGFHGAVQNAECCLPRAFISAGHGGPVLFHRKDFVLLAIDGIDGLIDPSGYVLDDLPNAVSIGDRLLHGLRGGEVGEIRD